jgi:demethylmenaquinone methyltransferase/2-methoxy-6-polyprenyl-1,4-benzoquinol methylase
MPANVKFKENIAYAMLNELIQKWKNAKRNNTIPTVTREQLQIGLEIQQLSNAIITPAQKMEKRLHNTVTYFVLPIFVLANAGISISLEMFDNISGKYDFLNRSLSVGIDVWWRKRMMKELRHVHPAKILDVATGTADVALEAVSLKPESIIGIDISEGMLSIGRIKIEKRGLSQKISLQKADSENLPFENDSFDAITVAFGVRNFENLEKGLSEINRVLKPGGKLVILEFSRPSLPVIKQVYDFYFRTICPWWGKIISSDFSAYKYLYDSVRAFPEGKDFTNIAASAGMKEMKAKRVTLGIVSLYTGVK